MDFDKSPSPRHQRKTNSRQGRRDRMSRDDRTPSLSPRPRDKARRGRDDRRDRKKSRKGKSKRSRSRSRHRSPRKNKKKTKRRHSSESDCDVMSASLLGEIKRNHGNAFPPSSSSSSHRKKSRKRTSSSSSSSSEEMDHRIDLASNGLGQFNMPAPCPPPPAFGHQYGNPGQVVSGIPLPPPPLPPPMAAGHQYYPAPPPPVPMPPNPPQNQQGMPIRFNIHSTIPPPMYPPPPQLLQPHNFMTASTSHEATGSSVYGGHQQTNYGQNSFGDASGLQSITTMLNGGAAGAMAAFQQQPLLPHNGRRPTQPVILVPRGNRMIEHRGPDWGTSTLKDYEVKSQIGEGTYGQVYKAIHKETKEQVALKRVRLENEKEGFPITAVREIKILRQLDHKNVVRLIDIVTDNASVAELRNSKVNFYLVFEYVDHDLMGLLEARELFDLSEPQICSLFKQLLEGLAYCHQAGILHRDIKCSNILVNNRGELKVADLGLARFWYENMPRPYTNRVITLWYRPPELLYGEERYGPEIDVWSSGCLLGELFTRKPMFNGNNEVLQLDLITKVCGSPTVENWQEVQRLPRWDTLRPKRMYARRLKEDFESLMSEKALDLLDRMLVLNPKKRLSCREALSHPWIRTLENKNIEPLNLPKNQDCHEMWSKQKKKGIRNSTSSGKPVTSSVPPGNGIKKERIEA